MKTLYLDCFAGIAGDMFIGALLNLVPDRNILIEGIKKITALDPSEYELIIEDSTKNGIAGINFDVKLNHFHHDHHDHSPLSSGHDHHDHSGTSPLSSNHNPSDLTSFGHLPLHRGGENVEETESNHHDYEHHHHEHRHLADIEAMILSSGLSERVKRETLRAFSILAEAEAHVHGTTPDKIHFHEVGAVDSIIDITGAFILMEALGWPRVFCSAINTGSGTVECAHGILPVPAPATEYLLRGLPVFSAGSPMERTTPTGALLAKILVDDFCTVPGGTIQASGFGLGNRDSEDMPNVLRALLYKNCIFGPDVFSLRSLLKDSQKEIEQDGMIQEKISLLETNIDDMNPQDFEPVIEKLFEAGALDVWTENINMKKSRPGVKFCCLARHEDSAKFSKIILQHTTSQGVRLHDVERLRLNWKLEDVETSLGKISVKTTELEGKTLRRVPEYKDLKALAERNQLPMYEIRKLIAKEI